ncbi:DUF2844 domain-containing protein [Paraburkholderia bryophila]|uniref:DUF2844 domain-containing protein n=1 Tax=Paraburkholderia bryophila TaxID=420952 RepID=A0A7Y9WAG0_9BURK|nr:DUF2844 domain-containing protein [Paraburkholderia bryophila]NYH16666.1 hypothetical protein [Paraburkholderia bryophila]
MGILTRCSAAFAMVLSLVASAHAELGSTSTWLMDGNNSSMNQIDATAPGSTSYTVSETRLASGTVVREYVAHSGTVFAIVWTGPRMAPLSTLLGNYFSTYLQGLSAAHAAHGGYGPAAIEQAGLVVHTGGHMGAFAGIAYLPQALPQGISPADLR